MRMTAASTTRLTNNGLSDKILISDYHLSEPITVDTQSSMDVDSCGTTQWDTSSASNSQSTLHNDQINMNRNDLTVNVTTNTSNSTHRMNTSLSYIPPGLVSVINESNCLTVCAIGHFSIGHTWGPYLIHIGSELRQKLTAFSTELDPDFLITLSVKSKDANYENVNSLIVGEEHTWIRVIHETGLRSDKNEYNLDILVDPILKTITLQVKCDINPQDSLIGVVRIVSGNHKVSDQVTMSSCHSSTLFSSTKSIASSTPPSMSANTTSTGPRRDKKCTHCGISFSNMDTLNAHMTHYCSRRPGLISSNTTTTAATTTTSIIQPSTSVTITSSEASTNNKVTPANKFSQNSTSTQRQNSSQSTGSIPGNFNSNVNSCNPVPISRYSTVEENGLSGLNSLAAPPIPEVSGYDSVQMSNLINPTLLNLFGVNNGSDISQIFQNPIASFMLPMLSRLIPPPPPPPPPPTPNATGDATNQSNSNALSPTLLTSMKRPCLAPEKLRSNHSSDTSSSLSSSNFCETRVSPTQTIAHIINQNSNTGSNFIDQHTPKVLFCPNCQQLYTSQYLSTLPSKSSKLEPFSLTPSSSSYELSSVNNPPSIEGVDNISRQNETIWNLSQLSEAAHRFGLILAAPLVTANGLQYIPVNLSSKLTNRPNTEKQHHSNNPQSINKKRQSTTPNPSCEITNDSLNCVNITSPSSSVSSSLINPPGNKPRDAPMPRLNTPNILDLSINPHNPQLLNSLALYNAINEFRDVQQQQQQQHQEQPDQSYFSPQLVPPGKRDIPDTMKDSSHNANHRNHHHLSNMNSTSKVLGNPEDIRANRLPISNSNQKSNEDSTIMPTEMSLLQAFSNILSYTNELLSNSQSIPFPFNINQLLLMLYASLAANSMNMTAQTTPNLSTLIPTPVSITASNNAGTNPVNISCPIITRVTENCDTNVVSDSLPPTVNNIFKGYSPFSSNVPFPPICINPLIPSNDQAVNTVNSSNLHASFPNLPAPVSTAATTTTVTGTNTTNIPSHLFQSLNSPSVHKMDPNLVGNIFTNVSNNNNGNNNNNNMNSSSSLLNILPALKLLGSIFPHFSTTEYQQEAQATQATSEMSVNSKQAKLQSNRSNANNNTTNNNEQITSPPGSPQSSILRPYLCRFCRTRFQAFSTFQAHQQFYCQGRKEVMKQLQTTKSTSTASDTLASTSSSTTLSCPSSTGPSANKRRCTTTTPENASSSQLQTLGGVSISQRNSANSSSTSSSGDEGDILKNNNNNNRLSPLNAKSSPNRNLLSSQEGIADYEADQLTQLAQWEPCGTSELRCSACGYVGQTPRGMKMHRKLHECNGTTFKTATRSTSEAKTRNDIKLESDNLTNSSDVSLHHGNDSNSSSSNDGRNLNNNNNNNSNVVNDSNSAFSDDHVKKEHL
ncbi:unnamed protein product [Trichobilharzia szidati]|nr:unnamed protein product [Trichobilharzia szidati]